MMFLVMAAPVVLAAPPPSASGSSDEVSSENKGEEDISDKAQGMLKSLLSSFQDMTAKQPSYKGNFYHMKSSVSHILIRQYVCLQ